MSVVSLISHFIEQIGQKALFRYTEFTSNECLSDPVESSSLLRTEDTDDSVSNAVFKFPFLCLFG